MPGSSGLLPIRHFWSIAPKQAHRILPSFIIVSKDVPPTLPVHAKDDPVDPAYYSEVYARELRKAGASVELNLYETGGHAFGVRKQGRDSDRWTEDAMRWLREIKVL